MNLRRLAAVVAATIFTTAAFTARAQTEAQIVWGSAQNITSDLDISTDGTLVEAYAFGGVNAGDVTVNNVTFTGFTVPSVASASIPGSLTLSASSGNLNGRSDFGSQESPSGDLSDEYQTLLTGGVTVANPAAITLTLSGLTIGQQYVFQFWTSSSSVPLGGSNTFRTTAAASTSISLIDNMTNTDGDLGQFAIGTFTATDTDQYITFSGFSASNDTLINAFQLRALPVPEPSTSMLLSLGLGLGGFAVLKRFRVSAK